MSTARQTSFWSDGPSLDDARRDFEERLDDGTKCPCCNRYAKRYRRTIYDTMGRVLIWLCQESGGVRFVELRRSSENGGDYAKLAYWDLVEAHPAKSKFYRPTKKGFSFVRGTIEVPRFAHVYNDRPEYFSGETMTIHDCLGEQFEYDALMADKGGVPKPAPQETP